MARQGTDDTIPVTASLSIPAEELSFGYSRSGGPGGQNVNKVSTRVTVWLDVAGSPSLTDVQKARIRSRLAARMSREGVLHVVSQQTRSQARNRELAVERLAELLREALATRPPRRRPPVPARIHERRLQAKRQRGRRKRERSRRHLEEE